MHRLIEREGVSSYAVGVEQRLKVGTHIDVIDPAFLEKVHAIQTEMRDEERKDVTYAVFTNY